MILFFFFWQCLVGPAQAEALTLELIKDKTPVEFSAKTDPAMLIIDGTKGTGKGTLQIDNGLLSGEVVVELNDFDTGIDTRTEHMKEKYLETAKPGYQITTLKLSKVPLKNGEAFPLKVKEIAPLDFEGLLTLHGQEKKVSGKLSMNLASPTEVVGVVTFSIKLTSFGIEIPKFAGVTLDDNVAIKAQYTAKILTGTKP